MSSFLQFMIPELSAAAGSLGLTLTAAFAPVKKERPSHKGPLALAVLAAGLALAAPFALEGTGRHVFAEGMLTTGGPLAYFRALILAASSAAMVLAYGYFKRRPEQYTGEFPALAVTAVLGMLFMVSSAHLLSLYVSLELQSLALYVLAAYRRDDKRSSEAGVKYFVLGALSSCLLLFGMSLIYGASGALGYNQIAQYLQYSSEGKALFGAGAALMLAGLLFKVSAAPFHMWTPDVYEGAPKPSVALFAGASKVAAIAALINLTAGVLAYYNGPWRDIFFTFGVLSAFVGALGALGQKDLRRLAAYSSVGHMGYVLTCLGVGDSDSAQAVAVYAFVYVTLTVGFFAVVNLVVSGERDGSGDPMEALKGLARHRPWLAAGVAVIALSLAGVPPFAGFFAKFLLFKALIAKSCYVPAALAISASAISAFYYLRLVKLMYFDAPSAYVPAPQRCNVAYITLAVCAVFNTLFMFGLDSALGTVAAAFYHFFG